MMEPLPDASLPSVPGGQASVPALTDGAIDCRASGPKKLQGGSQSVSIQPSSHPPFYLSIPPSLHPSTPLNPNTQHPTPTHPQTHTLIHPSPNTQHRTPNTVIACTPWEAFKALGCGGLLLIVLSLAVVPLVMLNYGGMSRHSDRLLQEIILPLTCLQETIFCAVSFWGLRRGWRSLSGSDAPFPWRTLFLGTKQPIQVVGWGVAAGLAAAGVGEAAMDLTEWFRRLGGGHPHPLPSNALDLIRAFHGAIGDHPSGVWIAVTVLFVVFWAPLTEELMFRGLLQGALQRKSAVGGLILSAILFAAFHLSLPYFAGLFSVGLVLGVAYRRTGALGVSFIAHAINNAFALALCYPAFHSLQP